MSENKRMANYELLRVWSMVMVVILHFLARSQSLMEPGMPVNAVHITGTILEFLSLGAVNVYVLLSGYFGVQGRFRPSKAVRLLCQIWFYALLVPAVLMLLGEQTQFSRLGVYGLVQYLFPIETEHYWFATSYFMLYLLSPVLNAGARAMTRSQLRAVTAGLLILCSVIKSVSPVAFVTDRYGYDLIWFICVYLLAAYLSLYGSRFLEKKGWLVYFGSCAISLLIFLAAFLGNKYLKGTSGEGALAYYVSVPFHYNFIFCLTAALGLFYGFSKIRVSQGRMACLIEKLGSLCFGVYLFHEHIDLREKWYVWLRGLINPAEQSGFMWFVLELLFCTLLLFGAGILIDYLRSFLFGLARKLLSQTGLYKRLKGLDAVLTEGRNPV